MRESLEKNKTNMDALRNIMVGYESWDSYSGVAVVR